MIIVKAVNPKYQSKVNRVVKLENTYNLLNDKRDMVRDSSELGEDDKQYKKINRMCEMAWDKYYDAKYDLPKREQENIEKTLYKVRGY